MIIEATVCEIFNYMYERGYLSIPCFCEEPEKKQRPPVYNVIYKLNESSTDHIATVNIAVQTYGRSLMEAALYAHEVKEAARYIHEYGMANRELQMFPGFADIGRFKVEDQYEWTDLQTNRYRYQTLIEITYAESPIRPFYACDHDHEDAPFRAAIVGTARANIDRI